MKEYAKELNCPFCLNPVSAEEAVRCPKCGVLHHVECWQLNRRCFVYGCDGWVIWSHQISERIVPSALGRVELVDSNTAATQQQVVRCIKCGEPVKPNQVVCWRCRYVTSDKHFMENCFGPAVIALVAGTVAVLVLIRTFV
ncbi:MAG: RING finger protein [Armatimonadota bacterium]